MNHRSIDAAQLHTLLDGVGELALIDIREVEDFRQAHIYHATYLPATWSERRAEKVAALVPRRETTVVLVGNDAVVQREAALWIEWGYRDVRVLDRGTDAWISHGYRVFRNLCVPSKALAESARECFGTPSVSVAELASRIEGERPPVIVDVRSGAEYEEGSIPDALGLPGGELVATIASVLGDAEREVVVTCAGRTRAIFGTQSLRDAGLPNPVVFLEGGTTAWAATGRSLEPGARTVENTGKLPATLPGVDGYDAGIERINQAGVDEFLADTERTTYLIDPRLTPGELPARISGVRHVPGGQLVEAVDEYLPVLRARVVLVDDAPYVRAVALARWLRASRLVEVFVFDPSGAQAHRNGGLPVPTRRAVQGRADGLELDVRQWSLGLPQLAELEPGGGFAL